MLSGTIGALLQSTMSYFSVAATVPKVGERHAVTSCSANDTIVKVRCRESAHARTRTFTRTAPLTHAQTGTQAERPLRLGLPRLHTISPSLAYPITHSGRHCRPA